MKYAIILSCLFVNFSTVAMEDPIESKHTEEDRQKSLILYEACKSGDYNKVEQCILAGYLVDEKVKNWQTPLFTAVENGHIEIVQLLIKYKADINSQSYFSASLNRASGNGYSTIVQLLIENGADVNILDCYSKTPLHCAAIKGNCEIGKMLIDARANIRACDSCKLTPLEWAVYHDHSDFVQLLIDCGAEIDACIFN